MTKKSLERLQRLKDRADCLRERISKGDCLKLDQEKAELSALDWAIDVVKQHFEYDRYADVDTPIGAPYHSY